MTKMFDVRRSEAFRQLRDVEKVATSIFLNSPLWVPGIFQVPAYAREMISRISGLPADDAEVLERAEVREERHAAFLRRLRGDEAPEVRVVLDESVLRRAPAGSGAMREQLDHLVELSEIPSVHIGVIPLDQGPHQGLAGPFEVHDAATGALVFFESAEGDRIVDAPQRVALYRDLVGTLMSTAVTGEELRTLLSKLTAR